jgi:hypothetical protein
MIFESKIGFSVEAVSAYYLGSQERFIVAKSNAGVLKLVLPHIFAFAILSMVVIHFLAFTRYKNSKAVLFLIYTILISQTFEIFSPFLIINISEVFVYLKLISFFLYITLIPMVLYILFRSILKD